MCSEIQHSDLSAFIVFYNLFALYLGGGVKVVLKVSLGAHFEDPSHISGPNSSHQLNPNSSLNPLTV